MKIQNHLKSAILIATLTVSCMTIQTSLAYNSQNYQVVNVATWDALNIRSGAGTGFDIIGEIPANTSGITITNDESNVGGSTWVKIIWNGQTGWVNKRYLTIAEAAVSPNNQVASTANQHTHPANRCTGSITHSHIAPVGHTHSYNCQQSAIPTVPLKTVKQNYYNPNAGVDIYGRPYTSNQKIVLTTNNSNTHTHPANGCTRSITHTHVSPNPNHVHHYNCQGRNNRKTTQQRPAYYGISNLQHTHAKSQCVSAISHSHKNGDIIHRHECPSSRKNTAMGGLHSHPANAMTRATTHSHPYQDKKHTHTYGR